MSLSGSILKELQNIKGKSPRAYDYDIEMPNSLKAYLKKNDNDGTVDWYHIGRPLSAEELLYYFSCYGPYSRYMDDIVDVLSRYKDNKFVFNDFEQVKELRKSGHTVSRLTEIVKAYGKYFGAMTNNIWVIED